MRTKLYELANKGSSCRIKRGADFLFQSGTKPHMMKSAIIKSMIRDVMLENIKKDDVERLLDEKFKELDYISEKQRRIQSADAYRQIMRYVNSEKRKFYPAKKMDVSIPWCNLTVDGVQPDAVFYEKLPDGRDCIELVRFKCKKPDVTQRGANVNTELYVLLKYGRLIAPSDKNVRVKASLYFLRKKNDNNEEEKRNFDLDFFDTKGGLNIVMLYEDFKKPLTDGYGEDTLFTDMDMSFRPLIKAFVDGIPEEQCSLTDCEKCDFKPICKFSDPPLEMDTPKAVRAAASVRLTPEQREVKEYEKGIVRINAGAGAGKTLVVSLRTVSLLNKGVNPEEIFLVTFTNAGAQEMRERITSLAIDDGIADEVDMSKMKIMTFNAFGDEIIKNEYERFGYSEAPHLIDDVERYKIVSKLICTHEIEGLDYRNFASYEFGLKGAVVTASRAFEIFKKYPKLGLSDIDKLYEKMDRYQAGCPKNAFIELYRLFRDYDNLLRINCLMEYSDQENLIFELLSMEPYYMERFGFKHIIIDEFQDTSETQIDIIKTITNCPSFESLMVVGDDSQSIYSFRETTPEFLINFDKVMGCKIDDISLVHNHRSTPEIIEFANKINRLNKKRIKKDLISTRKSGESVTVQGFLKADEERAYVVSEIKKRIDDGTKPEDIAVMARNKAELNKIADLLSKEDIPSVIQFPEKLMEDSRILAAISMLRAIKESFNTTDLLIYSNALVGGTLKNADSDTIDEACLEGILRIGAYKAKTTEEEKKEQLTSMLAELDPDKKDSLYTSFCETLLLRSSDKVFEYANDFSLFGRDQALRRNGNYPGVVLSTAHSSKGLEWPICFNMIGGYDKKELHGGRSRIRDERIEEERRLLFVSSTRARDKLYVTAPYTTGGKRGEYIYNQFLRDAYKANDQEFSVVKIERERKERELAAQAEKAKKKQEEAAKKLAKEIKPEKTT